jgi:ABC-type uncharacterized transport system permease subunit
MSTPAPNYFKPWIIFFLIATAGGALLGGVLGFFLGMIMGFAQVELGTIKIVSGIAGLLLSLPLSYFTFRWVVSEFIVKKLTQTPPPPPEPPLV